MKISPSKLRSARSRAMLSREELTTLADTSLYSLWRWEHGDDPVGIRAKAARKLHEALKVEPGALMAEEGPDPLAAAALPVLDPWAMLAEKDPARRAAALEAADEEEREAYAAELGAAIEQCERAIAEVAATDPVEEAATIERNMSATPPPITQADADALRTAQGVRLRKLWELRDYYVILRNEAEPKAPPEIREARELVGAAS